MLGPTRTDRGPEVAPVGIVIAMNVSLQELIVVSIPLNITTLLLCADPNPEPAIAIWSPTGPVVAERLVMTGAGAAMELIDTLSKVAVPSVEALPLSTAKTT